MKYYKRIDGGYIALVGINCGGEEITAQEYNKIMQIIRNKPEAAKGYDYKLKENLEWESFELPIVEEDETATEDDYQDALKSLGVNFNA